MPGKLRRCRRRGRPSGAKADEALDSHRLEELRKMSKKSTEFRGSREGSGEIEIVRLKLYGNSFMVDIKNDIPNEMYGESQSLSIDPFVCPLSGLGLCVSPSVGPSHCAEREPKVTCVMCIWVLNRFHKDRAAKRPNSVHTCINNYSLHYNLPPLS